MTCSSLPAFILAEKLSGERVGADRPLAPVDAAGGETPHMTQAQT